MPEWGKIAYEAYREQCGGKSLINNTDLPAWEEQRPEISAAWTVSAEAVLNTFREETT